MMNNLADTGYAARSAPGGGAFARVARALGLARQTVALDLRLGNRRYRFRSPRDFEFALAGATTVPVEKFGEMLTETPETLQREAKGIRKVERQLLAALEQCLEDPTSVGSQIRDLGTKLFSKDHRWREIVTALNALGPEHDEYKKLVLVKYLQYLASRQALVNMLFAAKNREAAEADAEAELTGEEDESAAPAMRETAMLDLADMQQEDVPRPVNPFERLPRGETVALRLPRGAVVEIMLAKHRFQLVASDPMILVDGRGHRYELQPGINRVGRHLDNDVAVDTAYRSVSRKHLIVDSGSPELVRVTDLSSHGTFVPPEYVEHALH